MRILRPAIACLPRYATRHATNPSTAQTVRVPVVPVVPVSRPALLVRCACRRHSTLPGRRDAATAAPPSTPLSTRGDTLSDSELLTQLLRPQRVWLWLGGVVLVGVTLVAFGPELKLGVSKHTADVASRSLQDETLQNNTRELASQIVQTVLNDPKVLDQASKFLQRLVVMDATRDALRGLVVHTLNDPATLVHVAQLARRALSVLLEDAETRRRVVRFAQQTLEDPATRDAVRQLVDAVLQDPAVRQRVAELVTHTLAQDAVKRSVAQSFGDAVHDVLSRPDVQAHAKHFVGSVVQDQTVQAQGGDAIWSTVMYAITPAWLAWIWQRNVDEETAAAAAVAVVATELLSAPEPGDPASPLDDLPVAEPTTHDDGDEHAGDSQADAPAPAAEGAAAAGDETAQRSETSSEAPTVGRRLLRSTTRGIDMLRRLTLRPPASAPEAAATSASPSAAPENSDDSSDDSPFWSGPRGGGFL
ncbi:hypothetical protein P43SY_005637 [Pythium insidiosum]|uniref:Uncharacterized protein n=1 Tax=Pythium insidiosum TaxID=114742 RepID=A0AAD5LDW5_PYTIN|nr:hypothetical protein P43SY_005637 [Pythium insidiosum]